MPSPFPGMNPYLEQLDVWHDFHQSFIASIRASLTPQIRPYYVTKIDKNVYLHELPEEQRLLLGRPDVAILKNPPDPRRPQIASEFGTTVLDCDEATVHGRLLPTMDRISEPYIEIRDAEDRELITVIELLSPTNKRIGNDRNLYLAKRTRLIESDVNFVEIDLLRGDARMPVEGLCDCDYCMMVCRSYLRPIVDLWPIQLRDRLPKIPIPLKREHADAVIDLQALMHQLYDAAGYGDYIYRGHPRPLLSAANAKWANEQMNCSVCQHRPESMTVSLILRPTQLQEF